LREEIKREGRELERGREKREDGVSWGCLLGLKKNVVSSYACTKLKTMTIIALQEKINLSMEEFRR